MPNFTYITSLVTKLYSKLKLLVENKIKTWPPRIYEFLHSLVFPSEPTFNHGPIIKGV